MQTVDFEEILENILKLDARYHRDAYLFVRESLDFTQRQVHKAKPEPGDKKDRHVSGQQLLAGIRDYGLAQYGPMTQCVFESWGVLRCEDFGEIVFNLVEHGGGMFGKTQHDSRDDFKGGYDFSDAFRRPYLPAAKRDQPVPPAESVS